MRYDLIQQLAFPIDPATLGGVLRPYQACTFPSAWKAALARTLYPDRSDDDIRRGVPLWSLTTAFAAFQPDIIVDGNGGGQRFWLGGARRPADDVLTALIHSGITSVVHAQARRYPRRGISVDGLPELLAGINPATDLDWREVPLLADDGQFTEHTFRLLPDLIAAHLAEQEWTVDHGGVATSRFQRIATADGAELMSWPPRDHPRRTRRWSFSYVVRLSVQTMPADPTPYLFVHIGLRRWASRKVFLNNNDRALSVAVKAPTSWDDGPLPPLIARARLQWRPGPRDKKEGRMDWTDDIVEVLSRLHGVALPDPAKLCADPLAHLPQPATSAIGGFEAGVFYRTGFAHKHPVGDGVSAKDRWRIFDNLADALRPHLTPIGLTTRTHGVTVSPRPPAKKDGIRIPTTVVAAAVGRNITIEVWWQTSIIRDEALAAISRTLQMPALEPTGTDGSWRTAIDHLTVTVHTRELGALGSDLDINKEITKKADRYRDAASRRIRQVNDWLAPHPTSQPTFVLVELDDDKAFTAETDPKFVLRTAAGRNGRNTQFLTPTKDGETDANRTTRIEQSLRELLVRQAGVPARATRLGLDDHPLPDSTRVVAIWLIRKNGLQTSSFPIAVCCDPRQPVIKARLYGERTWRPMREALLALSALQNEHALVPAKAAAEFIADVIDQLGHLDGPTLLINLAQNTRGVWKTTANTNIRIDSLATTTEAHVPAAQHPHVRYVRVRTNLSQETTQHYAYAEHKVEEDDGTTSTIKIIGLSAGLWQPGSSHGRTFLSTPDKPATASGSSPKGSRIELRRARRKDGTEHDVLDIASDVWNPQLVEFFVGALQQDDKPAAWAAAAHQYRYVAAHYDDPTLLPLPMHHGHRAGEYLLPGHMLGDAISEPT
ncbi:DUF3893 domain-containing protein [Micromonospora aurantiaca]|uniref:pPIWI_RE module domain-containing protein n=1 Tax=Micromonospora aurantiaca (nom. illeg.) TaxID=47850 RepID=UPI000F3E8C9B|nr:DUF3962 domain-containing protein [Micromonospora aurantiaca]RNH98872.1 DUF3893 domain-containing protein [Micromonospora aurantiaca]